MISLKLVLIFLITISVFSEYESKRKIGKAKMPSGKKIARATRGFKYQGKFYKVLGPKGKGRIAFEKLEETRQSTEEVNIHKTGQESKAQGKEEIYYEYLQQRKIAKSRGLDPDLVEIPKEAKLYLKENHVGKTQKRRRKGRKNGRGRKKGKGRRKRFAVFETDQTWTKAIVPYSFKNDISSDEKKLGKIRAQTRYEYWTCIRFVPWSSNTSTVYGLDHNNYLKHIEDNGCWAVLGNTKGDGQRISCCMDEICLHELGHALGLQHEQKNYLHNDWVRVNYDNVDESKTSEFIEVEPMNSQTFGYYDLSSRMHYSLFSFNKNAKPVMTINDPDLEYMVMAPDPYHFYQFYEASIISNCRELKCRSFKGHCENGGYVAYIRGSCTCRCPDGLDPSTGCTTKYYGDTTLSFLWPPEGFSLLKPRSGCPPGFISLPMSSFIKKKKGTLQNYLAKQNVHLPAFCTKLPTADNGYSIGWQPGEYCIFQHESKCPNGFSQEHAITRELEASENIIQLLSERSNTGILDSFLCCRRDGNSNTPIHLPNNHPFILIKYSSKCQQVKGMNANEIQDRSKDIDAAIYDVIKNGVIQCYYTPVGDGNDFTLWPNEDFAFMKPLDGCPYGFTESSFTQLVDKSLLSESYHLDTKQDGNVFEAKVCLNRKLNGLKPSTMWEPGQYCILKKGRNCPKGFSEGKIESDKEDNLSLRFCCREDGSTLDYMLLPNTKPFILLKRNPKSCQAVKDMNSEEEWYMVQSQSSKSYTYSGITPFTRDVGKGKLYIYVCYYWPVNYDCGEVIHLSPENPTVKIESPNYPEYYNNGQICAWTVMSPPDTQMILNFNYFDVEAAFDDSCIDALEVRFNLPGQPGINYCGETFKATTITEMNYLGLILSSGLTGQRPGFSATVKLLSQSDLCYTKKGEDYRGTLNVTRKFQTCLPWSQVQHCPHHMFHLKDLVDGLAHNYCRNPGDGTRPWCYTHAEECLRDYCDVCNIVSEGNPDFCVDDDEAKRGCRKQCGFCNTHLPKSVNAIFCGSPEAIPDSYLHGSLKEKYAVGEEVTYKCKTGPETETRKCLPDGTWSTVGFVCGRCPSGWLPFKQKCYKWFDVSEDKTGALDFCRRLNASVATAKDADENAFLVTARRESRTFWLGLAYVTKLGDHIWEEDDSLVTWSNWKSGRKKKCGYMDKFGTWLGIGCQSATFMSVICQMKPSERQICTDASSDCNDMITSEPGSCTDYQYFAWQFCPESCGLCTNGPVSKCRKNRTPAHTKELTGLKKIKVGQMFEFMCEEGYLLKDGDLRQACLKNGKLTGMPPICDDNIEERNNVVEIRERRLDVKGDIAVTGMNDEMRIHKNGRVVAWEFYSLYNGDVTFQIWRPNRQKLRLRLIGQNTIHNTKDSRKIKVKIPKSQQIPVQRGDITGIYVSKSTMSGLAYDKCISEYADDDSGNQLEASESKVSSEDWIIGKIYTFVAAKEECKVFSVTAYIL